MHFSFVLKTLHKVIGMLDQELIAVSIEFDNTTGPESNEDFDLPVPGGPVHLASSRFLFHIEFHFSFTLLSPFSD